VHPVARGPNHVLIVSFQTLVELRVNFHTVSFKLLDAQSKLSTIAEVGFYKPH
jgi:hypothetical protein